MIDLDEGDSELARWKHQARLLERDNRNLQAELERQKKHNVLLAESLAGERERRKQVQQAIATEQRKGLEAAAVIERAACAAEVVKGSCADEKCGHEMTCGVQRHFAAAIRARGAR